MIIKKDLGKIFVQSLMVMSVIVLSLLVSPFYINGDQSHYILVYKEVSELPLLEAYILYSISLSSFEYVHFILVWIASRLIEKDIFIALSNGLLAYLVIINLEKKRVLYLVTGAILLTNFYLFVLYFAAERLKYGMILFLLATYYLERSRLSIILSFLSISAHAQFLIMHAGILLLYIKKLTVKTFSTGRLSKNILYIFLVLIFLVIILFEHFLAKFSAYFEIKSVEDFIRLLVFFILAMIYSRNKQDPIYLFIPLFIAVMMFGGERVNMFGYFVFMYFALQVNRGINIGVISTSIYFAYGAYNFISDVYYFGDGFYAR